MYRCKEYTAPVWKGNAVLHESFLPLESREIQLLYTPDQILSVTNAQQTVAYQEGIDYALLDGKLCIPEGSAIKSMTWEEYNPSEQSPEACFTCSKGGFLKFAEGAQFHNAQYAVTYTHSDSWNGPIPEYHADKLPRTRRLLQEGKPFTFGFLGDSITVGANSSKLVNSEPFAPIWPEMITERLRELSGCAITYVNKAVGGTVSAWGKENATEFFKDTIPDVFLIAFGMNDASGGVDKYQFRDNCADIAEQILKLNPECELIFVSTTLPNPLANQFVRDHDTHEALLEELTASYGERAEMAHITSMHRHLLTRKHFYDMTGNNINHPNDFLARVYAQVILTCITEDA